MEKFSTNTVLMWLLLKFCKTLADIEAPLMSLHPLFLPILSSLVAGSQPDQAKFQMLKQFESISNTRLIYFYSAIIIIIRNLYSAVMPLGGYRGAEYCLLQENTTSRKAKANKNTTRGVIRHNCIVVNYIKKVNSKFSWRLWTN